MIHISVIHRNLYYFIFIFQSVHVVAFLCAIFLHIGISTIGLSLWLHFFKREGSYTYSYTMTVKYPCIVCNRAVAKNHKAVGCDHCGRWVHIACNYLNVYTYRKLQKDKSPWYCLCCIKRKYHFVLLKMSNEKTITNAIRQNKINHEELLRKAKNQFFTPN